MPRRFFASLLAAAVVTALAAGCSSTLAGTPTAASSTGQDPVAWIDAVCGSLVAPSDAATNLPNLAGGDLPSTQRAVSTYLGGFVSALDSGLAKLDSAGPSPIEGGEALATKVRATLTKARADVSAQKAKLDAVDPTDQTALTLVFVGMISTLQEVSQAEPLTEIDTNPKLREAADQSANCRRIHDETPGSPVLPTPTR